MDKLITILNGIHNLPVNEEDDCDPKDALCGHTQCASVYCRNCPFDYQIQSLSPDEHFVTQIHKTLEVMNHETRNSTPD